MRRRDFLLACVVSIATRALFTGTTPDGLAGSWTPDGSPQGIATGTAYDSFPGAVMLDASRLLHVYRSGTTHLAGGVIKGIIGTLSGVALSWGTPFTIHSDALDVRCEDAVSIIDDQVVIAARLYDGSTNDDAFLLICDDAPVSLSSSSTWSEVAVPLTGTNANKPVGRAFRVTGGYGLAAGARDTGQKYDMVMLKSAALDDWSEMTQTVVGPNGADDYTEMCIERVGADLVALLRRDTGSRTYRSVSSDAGATWTTPTSAHDGFGLPMFRVLPGGTLLSVYRDSPDGDTAWRTSTDKGASWGNETILDSAGVRSAYATLLTLTNAKVLCIYSVERSSTDADLYSQVFTRA